jgi:hypothetical protein
MLNRLQGADTGNDERRKPVDPKRLIERLANCITIRRHAIFAASSKTLQKPSRICGTSDTGIGNSVLEKGTWNSVPARLAGACLAAQLGQFSEAAAFPSLAPKAPAREELRSSGLYTNAQTDIWEELTPPAEGQFGETSGAWHEPCWTATLLTANLKSTRF